MMYFPNIEHMLYWIKERESIRMKKEAGEPKPWSTDPNLRDHRYCNVRRNDDKVTKWIHANWLMPYAQHPNVWFAMGVARLFNNIETLETLGYPVDGYPIELWKWKLATMKKQGKRVFNPAYIVSTNGKAKDKVLYVLEDVLDPFYKEGRAPEPSETLESYAMHLMRFDGFGSFIAGQVIADLKQIEPLKSAPDWWTWSNPGPGSRRGFNYLLDVPMDAPIPRNMWERGIGELQVIIEARTGIKLCAQDTQNCLCECSKYAKLVMGIGTPKQAYHGGR